MSTYTTEEFLSTIRAKYPVYTDIEDTRLLNSFLEKYPVYKAQISDLSPEPIPAPTLEPEMPVAAPLGAPTAIPEVRFGAAGTEGAAITRFSEKVAAFIKGDPEADVKPGVIVPGGPVTAQARKIIRIAAAAPYTFTVGFANALLTDPIGTVKGFPEAIKKGLNNFLTIQNPRGTQEQREKVYEDLVQDPTQFAFAVLLSHAATKPMAARRIATRAATEAVAEAPRIPEKAPVRPIEVVSPEIRPAPTAPVEVTTRTVPGIKGGVKVALEQRIERPIEPVPVEAPLEAPPPTLPTPPVAPRVVPARVGGVPVAVEKPVLGLNLEGNAKLRVEAELQKITPTERVTWEQTVARAKTEKKNETALETADEILRNRRPITDAEHVGMIIKAIDLKKDFTATIKESSDLLSAGNVAESRIARVRADMIMTNIDKLTEGVRSGRREAARVMNLGNMMMDMETYDIATVTQRAQASKGSKLSFKESAKIEKLVEENLRMEDQLAQAETAYKQLLAERDRLTAEQVTKIAVRRKKKVEPLEALLTERADIKSQLTAMGFRVNDVTGITAEGSFLVGKLAVNYIKEGAITLSDVVNKVRDDVPVLTERDVHQSLIAKDPRRQARARTEVTKRIADLKTQADLILKIEKAEKGAFDLPKGKSPRPADIRLLQARLRDLRAQAYKSGMHPSQLERAISTINSLQDQLVNQYRTVRQRRTIESPELASAREKSREIRRELNVENDLARLNEQLRTGEFIITERPSLKEIPPELERKQIALKRARRQIRVAIDEMAPLTAGKLSVEAINTLRTLKATADMSATLRQGVLLSIRRPVMATKAFGKSFKAFFRKYSAERVDNAIRSADHHYIREKSGLQLTEVEGLRTAREEMFGAQMIEKVPIIGDVVTASNRHMTTHLNLLRVGAFDQFLAKFPNATHAELTAWADVVNVYSGRGDLGRAAAVANTLSLAVFAPRFAVSRIQTPYMIFKYWKLPRVRAEIAKDMVGFVSVGTTMLVLADLAGFEVGLDPRNPDFGKIRIGDTRIDIWGGVQQPVRVVARVGLAVTDKTGITGKELTKRERDVDPLNLLGRFAAYKLAPSVTIPLELIKGKTIVGEPVTPTQTAARAVLPLWLDDVADAYRKEGAGRAVLVGGLTFLGVGATTYEDSETQTRRRIRKMKMEFNYAGADQLKWEWNMKNPGNPIRNVK